MSFHAFIYIEHTLFQPRVENENTECVNEEGPKDFHQQTSVVHPKDVIILLKASPEHLTSFLLF